jgi:hypothetical protein
MVTRMWRVVAVVVVLGISAQVKLARGEWSLFGDGAAKTTAVKSTRAEPSFFDKIGTGTKNLWYKMTGTKPVPERKINDNMCVVARPQLPEPEKPGFSLFKPKEEKLTPSEWMKQSHQVNPLSDK